MRKQRSIVAIANEQVSIAHVCAWIGMHVPEIPEGKSVKLHCPFGVYYHSDQGMETAFRVYPDSNSAFCFAGCGYFTPVWLAAQAWDRNTKDVAAELLDRVGYKPVDLVQEWARVSTKEKKPDIASLSLALRTYCSRVSPKWDEEQFESSVARTLDRCLSLLSRVHTERDALEWLEATKKVMSTTLSKKGHEDATTNTSAASSWVDDSDRGRGNVESVQAGRSQDDGSWSV